MKEKVNKVIKYIKNITKIDFSKISYSQSGEDLIIDFIFDSLGKKKINYIDIGANDPNYINNTAVFYSNGSRGINIEPNPNLIKQFFKYRPDDINLNIGIGGREGYLTFYVMDVPTMSTFSSEVAQELEKSNRYKITETIEVKIKTYNSIVEEYFHNKNIEFVSLDVEGLDFEIIKSIDFEKYRPTVFCVETTEHLKVDNNKIHIQEQDLIDYICSKDYFVYANTYINSIFVDKNEWKQRKM